MSTIIVTLEDLNRSKFGPIFVANRKRLATCTSVKIIDHEYLVTASLVGQKLYLIRYQNPEQNTEQNTEPQVIDSIDTTYQGKQVDTDLIDYDGQNQIATSNFSTNSVTLYQIIQITQPIQTTEEHPLETEPKVVKKLGFVKDIPLLKNGGRCHGVKFYNPEIICSTSQNGFIHFIRITDLAEIYSIKIKEDPKDICFLTNNTILIAYNTGAPNPNKRPIYDSGLIYLKFDPTFQTDSQILDKLKIKNSHIDALTNNGNKIYVTNQLKDQILVFEIIQTENKIENQTTLTKNETTIKTKKTKTKKTKTKKTKTKKTKEIKDHLIKFVETIEGYSFPHGIDYSEEHQILAVTNYGTNQITLTKFT